MPAMSQNRKPNQLRPVSIEKFPSMALGSVVITAGKTRVLCSASAASEVPDWLKNPKPGTTPRGWVTAEYAMLPGSTPQRKKRGPDSRATEIQRLIGRSLRAAVDLEKMPGVAITVDCDVLVADGGTRTAAVTGGFVALALAVRALHERGVIAVDPIHGPVTAVSAGVIDGVAHLDLDYALDSKAEVDMNVGMNHRSQYVELQGTGEGGTLSREQLDELLELAGAGVKKLRAVQIKALTAS